MPCSTNPEHISNKVIIMKLPFFRSTRPQSDPQKTVTMPPIPARPARAAQLSKTTRIEIDKESPRIEVRTAVPVLPAARAPEPSTNGDRIPLSAGSILAQLPAQVLAPGAQDLLASTTLMIPATRVLPQLATGKVSIPLAELLPLFPPSLLNQNRPTALAQQSIVLPLADLVAAMPAANFSTNPEQSVEIDSIDFENIPGLFSPEQLAELEKPVATPEPATTPHNLAAEPVIDTDAFSFQESNDPSIQETQPLINPSQSTPVQIPTPASPVTTSAHIANAPATVNVSLRVLVGLLPDRIFAVPRAELWQKADPSERVPLPTASIIPQLKTGRVIMPVSAIVKAIPHALVISPLPELNNESVPLPLDEIIPQLPPDVFTLDKVEYNEDADLCDDSIPTPFAEKTPLPSITPTRPTPAPVVTSQPAAVTPPFPAPAPEVAPEVVPVASTVDDDNFNIFAEKSATITAPVATTEAATVAQEPVTPVATPEPASEPAVAHVEPAAQDIAPVAEPEPVPVASTPAESAPVTTPAATSVESTAETPQFGIDINHCTIDDLLKIRGIGQSTAARIIEFRNARGHIDSLDELRQIPGVGRKTHRLLTGKQPRKINRLLGVEDERELSLQEIVRLTNNLPGIEGCILAMDDGMFLTGKLPAHLDINSVSVFAPQLFRKVGRYTRELGVGKIQRFTIFTDAQPMTIFQAGSVYLIVVHDSKRYSKVLLRRCERISQEIARLSQQRAVV
jgi:DNA uptake protein ComE-like DNA-binding protein/predicted regulator of Ras-like GTPase activity (Roadblock/LC7/MglB family)